MKAQYRIRNWSEYNAGLKQRGSITFWIDEATLAQWIVPRLSGQRGASVFYSNHAIATMATVKAVYGLAGRQCEGFLASILTLLGFEFPVPDHSTLSRRVGKLSLALPVLPATGARHVVVDSTGIKVYGEGEWKTRQYGISKRRTWRKLHLGVDEATGEILAAVVTSNAVHDGEVLDDLLHQIDEDIQQVTTDGTYDHRHCYEEIAQRRAKSVIPPRKDAVIWQHGNCKAPSHPRDQNLRYIRKHGRKKWKRDSGYHRRSIPKRPCFASRSSLAAISVHVDLTIKQQSS